MNLLKFLEQVDQETGAVSKAELAGFVHDMARILPEAERTDFLCRLRNIRKKDALKAVKPDVEKGIIEKFNRIKTDLERIEKEELCLAGSLNQEYDEWYCSEDEEFVYDDPHGVLEIVADAARFVRQCIDCGEYKRGYEIAEILIGLEIGVDGEYLEYTDMPIPIDTLEYYHLGNLNYRSFVVDALCAAYYANSLPERADAIYRIILNSRQNNITLEMVMQRGEELPETDEFMQLWISYLGQLATGIAGRLLEEALELANDPGQLLENARLYHAQHPELYEQYILKQMGKGDDTDVFEVGREALETISVEYTVRSRIALLMSRIALDQGIEGVEICWLEAFRSDSRVVNYLRLLTECKELSRIRPDAMEICHQLYGQSGKNTFLYRQDKPEEMNRVNPATIYMLAFLTGEFQYVREQGMDCEDALGWSMTFMKCGLAAFLLLLTECDTLGPGGEEMCRMVVSATGFDKADYEKGIMNTIEESSEEWFWKCFKRWKESVSISAEEQENCLQCIDGLITKRVDGIMYKNHRNYYGECAAYIAALGEVQESRGEIGGKQRTMARYKETYSRRSAFHGELRTYGMIDFRKKK